MNTDYKIIRDSIHGDIKLEKMFVDLLESPEFQRLYNVKQLGFAHLVFPGAHHTRLEHCLGTYYMACKSGEILNLEVFEKEILSCASFLHDVGHGPFSHTLESLLRDSFDIDHVDITEKIIFGEYEIPDSVEKKFIRSPSVCEILEKYSIDKKFVSDIIKGITHEKPYLSQMLNSAVDVDQLDYLTRDSYYTGVAYGMIDTERFLQTLILFDNQLMVNRKGVGVIENILMARSLMYSNIYFHKTVRIAELMLSKAIEIIPNVNPLGFFKMTDDELINYSKKQGPTTFEIITRLKYRNLYKQVYSKSKTDLDQQNIEYLKKFTDSNLRKQKEKEFEEKLNIPPGHIIIDVPDKELHLSEPRIDQTNIMIVDEGKTKKIDFFTPTAGAIRSRSIPDWLIMIITDDKYRNIVSENAEKILFS